MVSAVALLGCTCQADLTCLPCRARKVNTEILARGIRTHRWRNDPGHIMRHVSHRAGAVDVQRVPRRSCQRYIVDRSQVCADCGEPLATGKWALFFLPGSAVTKLLGRDGVQHFGIPTQIGDDSISCMQVALENVRRVRSQTGGTCDMLTVMASIPPQTHRSGGRIPFGWDRHKGVVALNPVEHAVRSTILRLREQGLGYRRIQNILNDAGLVTTDGKSWSAMAVKRIINTPLPQWILDFMETAPLTIELLIPAYKISDEERRSRQNEMNHNPCESDVA